jgi:hypothetical protein
LRFTVVWLKTVHEDVGDIWLSSDDRNAVTAATAEIDRELAVDAQSKGSELSEGLRAYDAGPLGAVFSVDLPNRIVEVSRIRLR